MADDGLKIELDAALAGRVRAFAEAAGAPIETVVREALSGYVDDWSETLDRLTEYDRTGDYVDAEEALRGFREAVAARFVSKA